MKNLFYSFGVALILGIPFLSSIQVNAQIATPCSWVGNSDGCDVYDCGDCMMWACGQEGGMQICGIEEEEESVN